MYLWYNVQTADDNTFLSAEFDITFWQAYWQLSHFLFSVQSLPYFVSEDVFLIPREIALSLKDKTEQGIFQYQQWHIKRKRNVLETT